MEKDNSEKRVSARSAHQTPITLELPQTGRLPEARMFNYSKKGLCFESDFYLNPGAEICIGIADSPTFITFPPPNRSRRFFLTAFLRTLRQHPVAKPQPAIRAGTARLK
jgi:hypothetical protein